MKEESPMPNSMVNYIAIIVGRVGRVGRVCRVGRVGRVCRVGAMGVKSC